MTKSGGPQKLAWKTVGLINTEISAQPAGLWTLVSNYVEGSHWLKIIAAPKKSWSYADAATARCGPDGNPQALLSPDICLCKHAPVGSLIAKIGGSSAGADDGDIFAVGASCVLRVPDAGGALYLTINDERAGMENNAGSVEILSIQVAAAAAGAAPPRHASGLCAIIAWLAKAVGCSDSTAT